MLYRSAHDQSPCLALFDRASDLTEVTGGRLVASGLPLLDIKARVSTAMREVGVTFREIDAKDCSRGCP